MKRVFLCLWMCVLLCVCALLPAGPFGPREVLAYEDPYILYEDNPDGRITIDQALGVAPGRIVAWLSLHETDGYYIGTPYLTGDYELLFSEEECAKPRGEYGDAALMNCTGFVANVFLRCGADLSDIGPWVERNTICEEPGGYINAENWYQYVMASQDQFDIRSYAFDSIGEALASGMLRKGDLLYFEPLDWDVWYDGYGNPTDCHIGFYWGETGRENRFWHSSVPAEGVEGAASLSTGNQISEISPPSADYRLYVWPLSRRPSAQAYKTEMLAHGIIKKASRVRKVQGR